MDAGTILELLEYGETINLECKKAETTLPNAIWETYSSFANTNGGVILLGVEECVKEKDPEKRFSFTSVKNPTQRTKIISPYFNIYSSGILSIVMISVVYNF